MTTIEPAARRAGTNPVSGEAPIEQLVRELLDTDRETRVRARYSLVGLGRVAVPALIRALEDPDHHLRTASALTLLAVADPAAAPALVAALDDDDAGVRWLAAEALVALRTSGLRAALHALSTNEHPTPQLKAGVRHTLREMRREHIARIVEPVLRDLDGFAPDEAIMVAAHRALTKLEAFSD